MSENEKVIREYAGCRGDGEPVLKALDALLAERRDAGTAARAAALEEYARAIESEPPTHDWPAYVSTVRAMARLRATAVFTAEDELKQEVERLRALVAGQKAGAVEVYAAGEVAGMVSVARTAALEEAKEALCRELGFAPDGEVCGVLSELASAPAPAAIPMERVREEALAAMRRSDQPGAWHLGVAALADALGINVDDALPAPVFYGGGCCDLYGTPHKDCRNAPERKPRGPPHREDADGCLADCPGCATEGPELKPERGETP